MIKNRHTPLIFSIFAVLYFPFVYYGQLSQSAYFINADYASGIVNYIGGFLNISALLYLIGNILKNSLVFRNKLFCLFFVWMILVLSNSFIISTDVGRLFKDFSYGSMWASQFMLYYILARKRLLHMNNLTTVFILLLGVSVIMTFMLFDSLMTDLGGIQATGFNAVYFVVCLLPCLFVLEKKWISIVMLLIAAIAILFSQKRTAIIAFAFQMIVFLFSFIRSKKGQFSKFLYVTVFALGLLLLFNYVNNSFLEGGITTRFERAENDDMGGRSVVWSVLLIKYANSDIFYKIFGHGCESFLEDGGLDLTAHNDYLETLYDYGLVNLIVLLFIVFCLLKKVRSIYNYDERLGIVYTTSLVAFLTLTMTSHLIFIHPCSIVFITTTWGFIMGTVESEKKIS